jgi:glycosyltransferase involved in cell wall biosynthesis
LDSGDAPLLALFGRICPWKGQDIAIAALQAIPAARLLLIGAPLFGEEAFEQALRAEAAASGVADRVHFLGFRRDVPALMSGADVVLHCSTEEEPFGRVIVEALLVGTPVIATRGGGASEIMASVDAPYQVEPRDAAGLALTSNKILVDLPAAQAEAAQIRDRAKSLYDLGIVSARTDQVLEDL